MLFKLIAATFLAAISLADDDDGASTYAQKEAPDWTKGYAMQLELSSSKPSYQYTVVPQTDPDSFLGRVVQGNMVAIDSDNWHTVSGPEHIAYLSCDAPDDRDTFAVSPNQMLNRLMGANLAAIVLYSTSQDWCSFDNSGSNDYSSVLSMCLVDESQEALGYLNETEPGHQLFATITARLNGHQNEKHKSSDTSPGNSAVAMSVLYSITGLVTLLFLTIIATGTIRAHRYPERYGPRGAFGGLGRQSRAKGIARAVLDTLPIVKFGNQQPAKPDPDVELESASVARDTVNDEPRDTGANVARDGEAEAHGAVDSHDGDKEEAGAVADASHAEKDNASAKSDEEGDTHLGCSICTEDFQVGEDVRVLPCGHQFHPTCVDPWLINVSGTCPLCRLDLQPGKSSSNDDERRGSGSDNDDVLPPPLVLEADESDNGQPQRNRLSRLLDINRLRTATREEQMEALRQMRTRQPAAETEARADGDAEDEGHRGARLAAKLKEKFMIRTRAQSEAAGPSDS